MADRVLSIQILFTVVRERVYNDFRDTATA